MENLTLFQRARLEIAWAIARLLRVPFDPYRAVWVWYDRDKGPRCAGPDHKPGLLGANSSNA